MLFFAVAASALLDPRPGVNNCTKHYATQFLDHFSWSNATFQQRYFTYDAWHAPGGPIFFYTGNEADVSLYANWTGLVWEHAAEFSALIVFAEHRYYGDSLPCPGGWRECGDYLSVEQALADYAALILLLRSSYPSAGPVVTFGGSYGGMLAAWMRMRYPALVAGAIASSAPLGCLSPQYVPGSYWAVVTRDATAAAGSAPRCDQAVTAALQDIFASLQTAAGRQLIQSSLRLCREPAATDADTLGYFVQAAFDALAMGNYPFPTDYISGTPGFPAPAWPMRSACALVAPGGATPAERMGRLGEALGVMGNTTGAVGCYDASGNNPSVWSPIWDFMVCTNAVPNEQPYFPASGPPNDMFYPQPAWPPAKLDAYCMATYGRTPRRGEIAAGLGPENVAAASNIVFANGGLDPWSSGAVTNAPESVLTPVIPEGAHHLDLFFATAADPSSVVVVRRQQLYAIRSWLAAAGAPTAPPNATGTARAARR